MSSVLDASRELCSTLAMLHLLLPLWLASSEITGATGPVLLSGWEERAGWTLLFDGTDTSPWSENALSVSTGLLADGPITLDERLGDFELEFEFLSSVIPSLPTIPMRVVARDGAVEGWDGVRHHRAAAVRPGERFALGPVIVEREAADARWKLSLTSVEMRAAFRGLRIRRLDALPAPSRALFDGKTLAGWRAIGDAQWSVEDGCIVGAVGGGKQSFLVTEKEYADFVLDVDLKNELPGNSGIQVRSHQDEKGRVFGYQIEIDPGTRAWSGGLYDEGRRGWLQSLERDPLARAAFRPGEWNHYRIECVGPHIRTWVNGTRCVDALDPLDASGFIGLQVHSGKDTKMRWRNFELRELGASPWERLTLAEHRRPSASKTPPGDDLVAFASAEEHGDLVLRARREQTAPRTLALLVRALRNPVVEPEHITLYETCGASIGPNGWRMPIPDATRSAPDQASTPPEELWITIAGSRVQIHRGQRRVLDTDDTRAPLRGLVIVEGSRREGAVASDVMIERRVPR